MGHEKIPKGYRRLAVGEVREPGDRKRHRFKWRPTEVAGQVITADDDQIWGPYIRKIFKASK